MFSHPNGWGGVQQRRMRSAAVAADLIEDTPHGHARVTFATEGEACIHFCVRSGLAANAFEGGTNIMVVDAGGGTVDISTYRMEGRDNINLEEISAPECLFQGSAIVGFRAREYLKHQLSGSRYGQDQDVDEMARQFDKTTKTIFRSPEDTAYIRFGSMRDKDPQYNIRNGQLTLSGAEVASIFKPSIEATKEGINRQCNDTADSISMIFLVGGFAASPWLFSQLSDYATSLHVGLSRPDTHTNKAVAEGAISFYLDHFVSVRVTRFTYGANVRICYNPADPEHLRRVDKAYVDDAGIKRVKDAFQVVLPKGTRVSEQKEFTQPLTRLSRHVQSLQTVCASVICYTGQLNHPRWTDLEPEAFTSLCTVEGDTSLVPHVPKDGPNGVYYTQDFHLILSFGLTELKAQLSLRENSAEKRCPAKTIYAE